MYMYLSLFPEKSRCIYMVLWKENWIMKFKTCFQVMTLPQWTFRQVIYSLCSSSAKCNAHKNHPGNC